MATFDGQIVQRTQSAVNEDNRKIPFPCTGYFKKEGLRHTSLSYADIETRRNLRDETPRQILVV